MKYAKNQKKIIMPENIMTIAEAKEYLAKLLAIVEAEDHGHVTVRTYQDRHLGAIWGEGVVVDCTFGSGDGTFLDCASIHYYVRHHEDGGKACLRRGYREDGEIRADVPFHGCVEDAAEEILCHYRDYYGKTD
jgi:hypothetical protein